MKATYFNFKKIGDSYLITNDFGQYEFLNQAEFRRLVSGTVLPGTKLAQRLLNRHFLYEESDLEFSGRMRDELLFRKQYAAHAAGLHIFVVTTACNCRCVYCQANSGAHHTPLYMTAETAKQAVDLALQSPEHFLNFEFQGGEPLLNFDTIRFIVEYAEKQKKDHEVEFSLVSNLTLLNDEIIDFLVSHRIAVSTSLDGGKQLHDENRKLVDGTGTFEQVVSAVQRLRDAGVPVGAIETTTRASLKDPVGVVHAYKNLGFHTIFIRPLTQLGMAGRDFQTIGYTAEEFLSFYSKILDEVIRLNLSGTPMRENHAMFFLKRIFGEYVNYMELRSPCGGGTGQIAYYPDGKIFTCDEARMLYEMGDDAFCMGDVGSSHAELFQGGVCRTVCSASLLETIPSCSDCVYQPYCGVCPVINYAVSGDVLAKTPRNYRCRIYMGMLDDIFSRLRMGTPEEINILKQWGENS